MSSGELLCRGDRMRRSICAFEHRRRNSKDRACRRERRMIVPWRVTSAFRSRGRRARQRTGISGRCIIEQDIHRRRPTSA